MTDWKNRIVRHGVKRADEFTANPHNPRKHPQKQREAMRGSLDALGWIAPVIELANGDLLDGHERIWQALQQGDDTPVPYIVVDLTEAEAKLALLTFDFITAMATFDKELTAQLMDLVNTDNAALQQLIAGMAEEQGITSFDEPAADPGAQVDKANALAEQYGTALGQIWQLGRHRLMIGDCTDKATVDALMQGEKADAVVTDPPYGQNQPGVSNDEPEKLTGIISGSVDNLPITDGVIIAFQSPRTFPEWLDHTRRKGFKFERMFWLYKQAQMAFPFRGWLLTSEAILVSSVGEAHWNDVHPYVHDCYMLSEVSGELPEDSGWHGSVKPLAVVKDLMSRVSRDDDIVYDPFLGSGTTLIAADQLNRTCYGCEIHLPSAAVIIQRWEAMTGQKARRMQDMGLKPELET